MTYVDLNPIRTGIATTLEEAEFTSIRERLLAAARGETAENIGVVPFADEGARDGHILPMSFVDYAAVLRWTAGSITGSESEETPKPVESALERLGLERSSLAGTPSTGSVFLQRKAGPLASDLVH